MSFSTGEIEARTAWALQSSARARLPVAVPLARPDRAINHVLTYGQSLATGWEGWPALSLLPRHDSLMLGRSVRPRHENAPHWRPLGSAALERLVATVQEIDGGLLTPEQVAGLPSGALAMGETVLEAAVSALRRAMLEAKQGRPWLADPTGRRLLASACGVGGRTLEALSRGAAPDLFARLRECMEAGRAAAEGVRLDYGVTALLFLQGEHNNWALNGSTGERVPYLALMRNFVRDFAAVAVQASAQPVPPAVFTYQTGGAYSSDGMGVPQAQLELALQVPGVFMAAPVYPVTDKGGHLDANGYRWLGAQFGKVMARVLVDGQDWRPLHPLRAAVRERQVLAEFHVPEPPLAWGRPYSRHVAVDVPQRGFAVLDETGAVPIEAVEVVSAAGVLITLGRAPEGEATLRYAGRTVHNGLGSLHDSDPAVAEDVYEYDALTGHDPSAEIAELVGRPYPLQNWCAAFLMPIQPA
jgi:hypothetical protein